MAARHLHITQPAISQGMQQLEHELGIRLFVRGSTGATLTRDGWRLLPLARDLLHQAEQIVATFRPEQPAFPAAICLGCGYMDGKYVLPPLMARLAARFPGMQIQYRVFSPESPIPALRRGELDAALTYEATDDPYLRCEPLVEDKLYMAAIVSHPWIQTGQAERGDLTGHSILLGRRGTPTRALIEEGLQALHAPERLTLVEMPNMEMAFSAAEEGLGITFVSSLAWPRLRANTRLQLVSVPGLGLIRTLFLVWPTDVRHGVRDKHVIWQAIRELAFSIVQKADDTER